MTKTTNRRWQLPPTHITSPIQTSSATAFAVGFIRTYWNLLQKGVRYLLFLFKKMGSRQKAVEAFSAVCDDSMLDRWIPDEDWVRHIRDNGANDCSITNLNMGLSTQCAWQNNHASLQGRTVFHNKKKIRILKNKVTKKHIRFYYVLSAGKPAPTIPSDQAFH